MNEVRLSFAERLGDLVSEKLSQEKGLTEAKIAEAIGISKSLLSEYKNPRDNTKPKEPRQETLIKIAEYFDVSLDYLVGRSNYRKDELRHTAPEELGLSEKSIERISEILTRYGRSEELNELLSANELPMILDCFHKYKKACYALSLVIIADEHNVPLDGIETNDEEIQNMIKAYELSRDGKSEEWKLLRSVYGVFGMLDPMSTTKATITDTIDRILRGTAIDINNHVQQIAADQFGRD